MKKTTTLFFVILSFFLGIVIIFVIGFLSLGYFFYLPPSQKTTQSTEVRNSPTNTQTPIQSNENVEFTLEEIAIGGIIGADDMKLPNSNDVRVKRAMYLLQEISNHTKETPIEISNIVGSFCTVLKEKYGKIVTRQQLLEETKTFFATADKKLRVNQKTKDVLLLVSLKYSN
jgi:hypothetical protein